MGLNADLRGRKDEILRNTGANVKTGQPLCR